MHPDAPDVATIATIVLFVPTLIAFLILLRESLPRTNSSFVLGAGSFVVLLIAQSVLAATGLYSDFEAQPPRFPLVVVPSFLTILIFVALAWRGGRLDSSRLAPLAFFQVFRLPLEILVLHELYNAGLMPREMTYEGFNFDVALGASAILIGLYATGFGANKAVLVIWNVIGVAFLINIMAIAILSLPTPFQQIGLDQPNVAPAYFPFILLPAFFVPAALWAHLASIAAIVQER